MALTPIEIAERDQLVKELAAIERILIDKEHEEEIQRCEADPAYWATTYVKTLDEEDPVDPIKPYPNYDYCLDVIDIWQAWPAPWARALAFEKSRRVLLTLTLMMLFLHDTMFKPARTNIVVSQNEEKANIQIERRAWFMYQSLPDWMRAAYPARCIRGKLIFPGKEINPDVRKTATSLIWSVPQENEQVRGETFSNYLMDEVGAQTNAENNLLAALPAAALGKPIGPRIILIGTAAKGFWERVTNDKST